MNPFREIYEQYVIEASFLWVLWSHAVKQPHYSPSDLLELESRINANLDGLITAPDEAMVVCSEALSILEPGEVFTAAVIAFRLMDVDFIQQVTEAALAEPNATPGLISAMGWLPEATVLPWIKKFLASKDLNHKTIALSVCSIRRIDPGNWLEKILDRDDCKANIVLYARAIRLIGELNKRDLLPKLDALMNDANEHIQFWAAWSSVLIGEKARVHDLEQFVFDNESIFQQKAADICIRTLPVKTARQWISRMAKSNANLRLIIRITGILGDPHAVPWLIEKMADKNCAKIAAEAWVMIVGADLEANDLHTEEPEPTLPTPNDDPDDESVAMDEDEHLPWPNNIKVKEYWQRNGQQLIAGKRYLMGQPVEPIHLQQLINTAKQRIRINAAMEYSLLTNKGLPNVMAPNH